MANLRKVVEDGFGYLNRRELEKFFELYSDDLRDPTLANLGLPTNKDGFKLFVGGFYASFSNPQFTAQKIVCEGDTTMFHWTFKGRHSGEFNGIPATGKEVDINAFTRFRLGGDGKIVEQHDVADLTTLARQLGAMK